MADPDLDRIIADLRVRREKMERMIRETFGRHGEQQERQGDPDESQPAGDQQA